MVWFDLRLNMCVFSDHQEALLLKRKVGCLFFFAFAKGKKKRHARIVFPIIIIS